MIYHGIVRYFQLFCSNFCNCNGSRTLIYVFHLKYYWHRLYNSLIVWMQWCIFIALRIYGISCFKFPGVLSCVTYFSKLQILFFTTKLEINITNKIICKDKFYKEILIFCNKRNLMIIWSRSMSIFIYIGLRSLDFGSSIRTIMARIIL